MGDLPPRGIRVRGEHLTRPAATGWWLAWALLAAFIVAESAGTWARYGPGQWAPLLIRPVDVAMNVAIYVPFGILGMLALRRSDARGIVRVMGIAVLFSAINEALQLYTIERVGSLTDIASAAVGSCAGATLIVLLRPR